MRRDELWTRLAAQPDFTNVKSEIQEEVERRGHTTFVIAPGQWPQMMDQLHYTSPFVLGLVELPHRSYSF